MALRASSKGDGGNNDDQDDKNKASTDASLSVFLTEIRDKWDASFQSLQQGIPEPILKVLQWINDTFHKIKWIVLSFALGGVLSITALLVPLYDSVQTVTQPVALFETILSDLEQAYVEPVDTNELFETGVAAMLRSLDPYTEFEGCVVLRCVVLRVNCLCVYECV